MSEIKKSNEAQQTMMLELKKSNEAQLTMVLELKKSNDGQQKLISELISFNKKQKGLNETFKVSIEKMLVSFQFLYHNQQNPNDN